MPTNHNALTDPELHEPKGAATAVAGTVYVADGAGSGSWNVQAGTASNTVSVQDASDFPTAVADVITLAPSTIYEIGGIVDIGNDRIVCSEDSILIGTHRELSGITSTTTGALFTATGVDFRIQSLTLDASTATKLYEFDGSLTATFSARDIKSTTHTGEVGTIANSLNTIMDFSVYSGGTDGVSFSGTNGAFLFQTIGLTGFTGTGIDLGVATVTGGSISGSTISGTGGADTGISGAASSANIAAGYFLYIEGVNFNNTTTPMDTISTADARVVSRDNRGVPSSHTEAMGYDGGSGNTTTIVSSATPVKVNVGTDFVDAHSERFTVANDGRITYDAENDADVQVHFAVQFTGASGTNTFNFYIAKNGVISASSKIGREVASTSTAAVASFDIISMSNTDYLEIWVENDGSTTDCDTTDLKIKVNV